MHELEESKERPRSVKRASTFEWDADGRIARDLRDLRRMAIGCAVLVVALVLGLTLWQ